jgi:hypothetical protein
MIDTRAYAWLYVDSSINQALRSVMDQAVEPLERVLRRAIARRPVRVDGDPIASPPAVARNDDRS